MFDCENICTKRCAGPCQGRPTTGHHLIVDLLLGAVCCVLALALFFLAIWGVVHAAGLDRAG